MPKDYRDHFHQQRTPEKLPEGFHDRRDSLTSVYVSLIPFLIVEYFVEIRRLLPAGLLFPTMFLLYWSFYYTYYKPGFLENQLSTPEMWNFTAIPTVLLGVCLWFLKYTVIEILHLLILRWIIARPAPPLPPPKAVPPSFDEVHWRDEKTHSQTRITDTHAQELARALSVLGLSGDPSLEAIHHRYRELAKLFHPDLNPDVTDFGRRFIQIEQAYRKLAKARNHIHQ